MSGVRFVLLWELILSFPSQISKEPKDRYNVCTKQTRVDVDGVHLGSCSTPIFLYLSRFW